MVDAKVIQLYNTEFYIEKKKTNLSCYWQLKNENFDC